MTKLRELSSEEVEGIKDLMRTDSCLIGREEIKDLITTIKARDKRFKVMDEGHMSRIEGLKKQRKMLRDELKAKDRQVEALVKEAIADRINRLIKGKGR